MKQKQASFVINPRAGQNLAKLSDILAVLAAAGWKTDLGLKEYGGHTMALATKAAEDGQDLVIAYGGDGTLNQVVNGVMHASKSHSVVGLIPGGTANVWASEIGIPTDPVKAALTLIDSEARRVDVGHVEVDGINLPGTDLDERSQSGKRARKKPAKAETQVRQHFLLMAGLGIDAAIMGHVSKPLKYRVGALAVGVSTARELPANHTFPVEIQVGNGNEENVSWKGEALQVVIGNTRLYADIVEMTPDAYIDDGVLDVCVITAGNPLTTMQQIASLLLRHHPDNLTAKRFQGAQFSLKVPASVALQLDGSAVKLKDYLNKEDQQVLAREDEAGQMMVTYHFNALPHALRIAIPRTYNGVLFEASDSAGDPQAEKSGPLVDPEAEQKDEQQPTAQPSEQVHQEDLEQTQALLEQGRKVIVVGVSTNPAEKQTYIVAGTTTKASTGEATPVAVCINAATQIRKKTGEKASLELVRELSAGHAIVVEGKKSKRGVILAKQLLL